MADIAPNFPTGGGTRVQIVEWSGLTSSDTAIKYHPPFSMPAVSCFQVQGTFSGATVSIEGSNDGNNYHTLKDVDGNDAELTAAGIIEVSSAVAYIRPSTSGGTVTITAVFRG